jgi:hypothetical protein
MDAHKVMGDNVTYEDLKRIADGNGKSVDETLGIVRRTADIDRGRHADEYTAEATTAKVGQR